MNLFHGDCLEVMKTFEEKSVDLIITDPPYGIGLDTWDSEPIGQSLIQEMFRVSRNQLIFGGNYFDLPKTEAWIVWYKQPFLPSQAQAELIWTSLKFKPKVFHYRYAGNCEGYPGSLKVDYKKKSVHTAQKPVEVMNHLVREYSKPGDTILDPFMGSGTTGVAARILGREFIGIEKDAKYFEIANKRIKETVGA